MGELEGEYYCKPVLIEDKGWEIKENTESRLFRTLDLCRGCFDKSVGYAMWNIVETWKEVRGELSGADLRELDLSGVGLNGVKCNRFYEANYLCAIFDGSRVDERNIFPQGHFTLVTGAVYSRDGKKILSASLDGIKEWNAATGQYLKDFHGQSVSIESAYSPDGQKILSISDDGTIREWDASTGRCLKIYKGDASEIDKYIQEKEVQDLHWVFGAEVNIVNCETYRMKMKLRSIPGLFIQGCSFKNLHPQSNLSDKSRALLKQYGAKLE
jgi:hypothetical protein